MKYESKYLVGEIGEKAEELYAEYPDVMMAIGKEAIRAYKTGFRIGFMETSGVIVLGGMIVGACAVTAVALTNKLRKKKEVPVNEFEEY